jgi:hypothetical protein
MILFNKVGFTSHGSVHTQLGVFFLFFDCDKLYLLVEKGHIDST